MQGEIRVFVEDNYRINRSSIFLMQEFDGCDYYYTIVNGELVQNKREGVMAEIKPLFTGIRHVVHDVCKSMTEEFQRNGNLPKTEFFQGQLKSIESELSFLRDIVKTNAVK